MSRCRARSTASACRPPGARPSLKVVSSQRRNDPDELVTYAAGPVPAALIDGFAAFGNHSMSVETQSGRFVTDIRLGNTGARQALPQLATSCVKPIGDRAELAVAQDRWPGGGEVRAEVAVARRG